MEEKVGFDSKGYDSQKEPQGQKARNKRKKILEGSEPTFGAAVSVPARADRPSGVDSLNRGHYVRALAALIMNKNTEVPLTIGIYGRWGSGKSSFMEQLRRQLSAQHEVVDFNPWRYNDTQQILIGLIRAIAEPLDKQMRIRSRIGFLLSRSFLSQFSKFQKRMSAASKKLGNWATGAIGGLGIWSATPEMVPNFPNMIANWLNGTGVTKWLNYLGIKVDIILNNLSTILLWFVALVLLLKIFQTIRRPFSTQFEAYLGSFKTGGEELRELTRDDLNKISEIIGGYTVKNTKRHQPPIVILLDDLDRCPPDSIVEVLEAINLFLTNLPFVTVFGLDSKVVTQAVAERYNFMLEKKTDQSEREEYGRFFLGSRLIQIQ